MAAEGLAPSRKRPTPWAARAPAPVPGLTGVVAISAGWDHVLALRNGVSPLRTTPGLIAGVAQLRRLVTIPLRAAAILVLPLVLGPLGLGEPLTAGVAGRRHVPRWIERRA